jgi:hypothetical protein
MEVREEILTMGLGGLDACRCVDSVDFWENGVGSSIDFCSSL